QSPSPSTRTQRKGNKRTARSSVAGSGLARDSIPALLPGDAASLVRRRTPGPNDRPPNRRLAALPVARRTDIGRSLRGSFVSSQNRPPCPCSRQTAGIAPNLDAARDRRDSKLCCCSKRLRPRGDGHISLPGAVRRGPVETMDEHTSDSQLQSKEFKAAELRSELTRGTAVLGTLAGLLALLLIRGGLALAEVRRGEVWPFAVLLAAMTGYELVWLRSVKRAIASGSTFSRGRWAANILVESLFPTIALFLQIETLTFGPEWTLTSPVILGYFLFIILSTLHL